MRVNIDDARGHNLPPGIDDLIRLDRAGFVWSPLKDSLNAACDHLDIGWLEFGTGTIRDKATHNGKSPPAHIIFPSSVVTSTTRFATLATSRLFMRAVGADTLIEATGVPDTSTIGAATHREPTSFSSSSMA